ncbi:MAG: Holliday junction branch migration protein RuvA [Leptospiraceae bacterium]|nr:Holliday junction branch migration protein RuvA [Leptospiraceae bacterium]
MIAGLKGKKHHLEIGKLQLDVNGVIYEVLISFKTFEGLKSDSKDETYLHVFHSITERTQKLFGFTSRKERDMFELIKSLQGIGEMTALRVLSFLTPEELLQIVIQEDRARLEKIPKVKGKTSEKILFEIKQNIKKFEGFMSDNEEQPEKDNSEELALLALLQLGFDERTALKEIKRIKEKGNSFSPSEYISEILKST